MTYAAPTKAAGLDATASRPTSNILARLFSRDAQATAHRTFYFGCFLLPAFFSSSAMFFCATRLLGADNFGIFFFAYSIQNVGCAGSIILNIALTRYYGALMQQDKPAAIAQGAVAVERVAIRWGFPLAIAFAVGLAVLGGKLGAHAWSVAVLIAVDVYVSYLCDLQRAAIQSQRKTNLLGVFILLHMVLRFVFSTAMMIAIPAAWSGIAGWLAASIFCYVLFRPVVFKGSSKLAPAPDLPSLREIPPLVIGYGLSTAACYLDVVMAYLLLPSQNLGIYGSSSVLPKMILSGSTPILLMLLPFMSSSSHRVSFKALMRVAAMLLSLVAAAVVALLLAAPLACNSRWGFAYCRIDVFDALLLSTIPLILMRTLNFAAFAAMRNWTPLLFAPVLVCFAIAVALDHHVTPTSLARNFALFSSVNILVYLLVSHFAAKRSPRSA